MGAVFLGRGPDGTMVAIKVIRPELAADPSFRDRFADEVRHARRVASFCTATVLDYGEEDGRPYMVTEYVDGTPLEEYIEAQGALPPGTLHGVAVGVAAALTAIHSAGLIHRDLKPSNVLLSVSGPRVIDFGIARATDTPSQHTQAGFVIGSPGWMAPEQVLQGEVGTAVDVFAWGCLVAFAGLGRHPYGSGSVIVMAARAEQGDPDLDGLPQALRGLVTRALAPAAAERPTAQDLLLALVGGADQAATASAAAPTATAAPAAPGEPGVTRPAGGGAAGSPEPAGAPGGGGPGGDPRDGLTTVERAQAVANEVIGRNWEAEALPPPWVPPSPPYGVRAPSPPYGVRAPSPPPAPPPAPLPVQPVVRQPGPPPIMAPQYPPYQPYAPAKRRKGSAGCLLSVLIMLALVAAGGYAAYRKTRPTDAGAGTGAGSGGHDRDGQFTFTVKRTASGAPVQCGAQATVRGLEPANGMFCLVRLTVTNSGDKTRTLSAAFQKLSGASGTQVQGRHLLRGPARGANEVSPQRLAPGETFTGVVVFDVKKVFRPSALLLRDGKLSGGLRFTVTS